MARFSNNPLFCENLGHPTEELQCCYPDNQSTPRCREIFNATGPTFNGGCDQSHDCIVDCRDTELLYSSKLQNNLYTGNNLAPIRRFSTCVNVPALAGYSSQGILSKNISDVVAPHVSANTTDEDLKSVTSAVTECLTATCRNARNRAGCIDKCTSVNLLTNNTSPNIQGINECLELLCSGGVKSLPYADADVIGIGVFASYIMQCMFVVILWFGLLAFETYTRPKKRRFHTLPQSEGEKEQQEDIQTPNSEAQTQTEPRSHRERFQDFMVEFHTAQCYFSGTLQIASLSYGIFETDMLVTFMLMPLATNGVLPVVFAYVLLFRCGRTTMGVTLLTVTCWILSSLVYWVLYSNFIPIDSNIQQYRVYQQFMYKLAARPACGGYSALAVCPENWSLNREPIYDASRSLRVLTPIIWTFATLCLFVVFGLQACRRWNTHRLRKRQRIAVPSKESSGQESQAADNSQVPLLHRIFASSTLYWLATICFLATIGMQLSLLAIGTSLNMTNRKHWGFGQIVAVTIWIGPLLGYVYDELTTFLPSWTEYEG